MNEWFQRSPTVMKGAFSSWPAVSLWSWEYLVEVAGDCVVPMYLTRGTGNSRSETAGADVMRAEVSLHEALQCILQAENEWIAAVSACSLDVCAGVLARDLYDGALRDACGEGPRLWIGPGGKAVPLHRDLAHGLLIQILGQKQVRLWPRDSVIEPDAANPRLPKSSSPDVLMSPNTVETIASLLGPGDGIGIPEGWWHQVTYDTPCVSVNYWLGSGNNTMQQFEM